MLLFRQDMQFESCCHKGFKAEGIFVLRLCLKKHRGSQQHENIV